MDPLTIGLAAGGGGLLSGLGSVFSGLGGSRRAARERRRTRQLVAWATAEAKQRTAAVQTSQPYQLAEKYYTSAFEAGVPSYLARDVAERMRVSQSARGIAYGAQPAVAESVGIQKLAEQQRQALAPALLQLAQLPLQIEQQAFNLALGQSGLAFGAGSVGPSPLELAGSAMASLFQGALGGAQIGAGLSGGWFGGGGGGGGGGMPPAASGALSRLSGQQLMQSMMFGLQPQQMATWGEAAPTGAGYVPASRYRSSLFGTYG